MPNARLLLIPTAAPFAEEVAQRLLARHREDLPDLSRLTLILASPALTRPLRMALAVQAGGALLGPRLLTAQQFAAEALPAGGAAPLSSLGCRLRLAEWLTRLRSVFPGQEPTRLGDALFEIFEALILNAARLPDDEAALAERLRIAYGASLPPAALSREAQIVHELWRFYAEEIGDRAPAVTYLRGLRTALAGAEQQYWLGFDVLARAEAALLRSAVADGRIHFWAQGRLEGRDGDATRRLFAALDAAPEIAGTMSASPRAGLLDACFSDEPRAALERAAVLTGTGDCGLRLVAAANAEHEAHIVDLAVREALLAGARRVAVVSGDRRLARRLRALLERAGVGLEDRVGWALSTSRAAAALASWLECLETGFGFRPLLDLLKCGFHVDLPGGEPAQRPEPLLAARLERDVLFDGRSGGQRRGRRGQPPIRGLRAFSDALDKAFPALFERLRIAAIELPVNGPARLGADWAAAVIASLKAVGVAGGLAEDDAGSQVLALLGQLQAALDGVPLRLRWPEFRALLDRHLEDATFRPAPAGVGAPRVALYTLNQTQGLTADALILASATPAQLPGAAPGEVFFNQAVRRELGLDGWPQRQAQTLARLRRVLEAAPQVTITYAASSEGEAPRASAWLEALAAFAQAAGFAPLHDKQLAVRALSSQTQISSDAPRDDSGNDSGGGVPATMPRPSAAAGLLDFRLSAGGHQALIDCPYQFHVRNALGLYAEKAPDEPATRSDYGDRVHRILRAFHQHHDPRLPLPYTGALTQAAVTEVRAKLDELADAVFAADLAARPLARAWRHEFSELVPWLADQLVARGDAASIEVELERPREVAGWTLKGAIDRLERREAGASVIDYKTGAVPKKQAVLDGEAVQLPHYALMVDDVIALEYWNLKEQKNLPVTGTAVPELAAAIASRLAALRTDLAAGHAMPAHGDDTTCSRCDYDGICRRDAWSAQ